MTGAAGGSFAPFLFRRNVASNIWVMANSLSSPQVTSVLGRLFGAAGQDDDHVPAPPSGLSSWSAASAAERADALQDCYLPISADAGKLLYNLVRSARPDTVVEFGTSFGISTIYLAAAVTDNGVGRVVGSELSARKVEAARANLSAAGVGATVTILPGDARQTLAEVPGPIGLVLLDGWKDLCLPVLRVLERRLAPGALVAADDITLASLGEYLAYVRDAANGYVSVAFPVEDGVEISCWTGR
jgi:predicted O-methyltransferase YrrM